MTTTELEAPPQTAELEIHDLHVTVEGKEILKGIDLTVRQGETHALWARTAAASPRWPTC